VAEAGERSRQVNRLLQALAAEYARGWPMYNDPTEPGPTELPDYVTVKAWMLIKASDEMGNLINRLWQQRRDILQECADATGRPMHQPIPGLPMIEPRKRS
jgi:hypothetical protein